MINYFAVAACSVFSMVFGGIWYGPLFGKKWAELVGADLGSAEVRKKMQKDAIPLYFIQFLLTLFQVWALAGFVGGSPEAPQNVAWIWIAFIVPTLAGSVMWTNETSNAKWLRFLILAGYQLVVLATFGFVLGIWK